MPVSITWRDLSCVKLALALAEDRRWRYMLRTNHLYGRLASGAMMGGRFGDRLSLRAEQEWSRGHQAGRHKASGNRRRLKSTAAIRQETHSHLVGMQHYKLFDTL